MKLIKKAHISLKLLTVSYLFDEFTLGFVPKNDKSKSSKYFIPNRNKSLGKTIPSSF